MNDPTYAEDINYFKTSQAAPDTWIDKAIKEIEKRGGLVLAQAYGRDQAGRAAYMLQLEIGGDRFRVVWPVLPQKGKNNEMAAKRQAATMLYHDIKARCLSAQVLGSRAAFFTFLLLPNGQTAAEVSETELLAAIPSFMLPSGGNE